MKPAIHIKRIYEPAAKQDGFRILVDRLWPRGLKKEDAKIDVWAKDIAPSAELRKWYHQGSGSWDEFKKRYHEELRDNKFMKEFTTMVYQHKTVTLLYAVHDEQHNHAILLQQALAPQTKI